MLTKTKRGGYFKHLYIITLGTLQYVTTAAYNGILKLPFIDLYFSIALISKKGVRSTTEL